MFTFELEVSVRGNREADIAVENVENWVNSEYTEFFWTSAKLGKPLELTIICRNNE